MNRINKKKKKIEILNATPIYITAASKFQWVRDIGLFLKVLFVHIIRSKIIN
jgi:hypothetical protein